MVNVSVHLGKPPPRHLVIALLVSMDNIRIQPFLGIVLLGISEYIRTYTFMDRRTKQRIDLQLLCRLSMSAVLSTPLHAITENISRDGILMRWLDAEPLPTVGSSLTVEFGLPENGGFGKRAMRCRTTVVRITSASDGQTAVGLRIDGMNFIPVPAVPPVPADLIAMPVATERVN